MDNILPLGGDILPQDFILRLSGDGGFLLFLQILGGGKFAFSGLGPSIVVSGSQVLLRQGCQLDKQRQVSLDVGKESKCIKSKGSFALPLELGCHE